MGDRIQARPVDNPDLHEALTQGVQRGGIAGRRLRQHLRHNGIIEVGKETPVQGLAAFEKGFWSRLDTRPARPVAGCGFLNGLGQGLRGTQDDFGPERRQGRQAPSSLAFCGACLLKDRLTQARRQVLMQHLHGAQQIDALFRGSWGCHTMSSLSEVIWPYTSGLYSK